MKSPYKKWTQNKVDSWFEGKADAGSVPNKIKLWFYESYGELGRDVPEHNAASGKPRILYTLYPKRFYQNPIVTTRVEKDLDFVFIGSFTMSISLKEAMRNRSWVLEFAKDYFKEENSLFINTSGNYRLIQEVKHGSPISEHPRSGAPVAGMGADPYLGIDPETGLAGWRVLGPWDKTWEPHNHLVPKMAKLENKNNFDDAYFSAMMRAKFAPCPGGDGPWSMRFYEALMCRAIPIVSWPRESYRSVEESQLDYKYYLADDGPFVYRKDWAAHNYELFLKHHTLYYNV